MVFDFSQMNVFIRPGATDLRKAVNGLALLVAEDMNQNIFSQSLFLFCNRERKLIKMIYWDHTGFCLWQKRLEKHKYPWPKSEKEVREITQDQLSMLLSGIDFWNAHTPLKYSQVS